MIHDTFITNADPGDEQQPSPGRHHPDCGGFVPYCGCSGAYEDFPRYEKNHTQDPEDHTHE